jgi:purine-cytosine permease-like protein
MADDDEAGDTTSFDPTFATAGPRRSTFSPPPASAQYPVPAEPVDDDALADALATGLAPAPAAEPAPTAPAEPPVAGGAPASGGVPAWSSLPAPDPAQAVPLRTDPPVRRSMADDELAAWVDNAERQPGGTLDVIEQLETQVRLRDEEAREFMAWENRMLALGTPDAIETVNRARGDFADVLPAPPTGAISLPPQPVAPPEPPPLPAWDVPAPSAAWSPEPEPVPVAEPEPELIEPPEVEPEPFRQDPDEPFAQPTAPEFRDEQAFAPVHEPVLEPTIDPDPEPAPEDREPELTIEPEPEPVIPPLIEPPLSGGISPFAPPVEPVAPPAFDFTIGAPIPPTVTRLPDSFDALLTGGELGDAADDADEERFRFRAEPDQTDAPAEVLFIEPMSVAAGEPALDTGTVTVVDQAYDEELDDDVDETDRFRLGLGPVAVDPAGMALLAAQPAPPSGPISTVRIPAEQSVLYDDEPVKMKVFSVEPSGVEATPVDHRVGNAARMFWLWFATNSSILSLGLGATVFAIGLSLRQSIFAVAAGVLLSFLPLGLTTLAGKRSGQPTMVISRATFGVIGNVIPALLALVTRVFWGAVLLWLLASSIAIVLVGAGISGSLGERQLLLISLAAAFIVAVLVAFAGYPLFAKLQLVLSLVSGILVVGLIVLTAEYIDLPTALTNPDGPWILVLTGAVLVFSFVGLIWAHSGADLARYQRGDSSGASSMVWATFGTALPTFLLIGYGALLAASDSGIARGFLISPLDTLAVMLPIWYPVPLIAATTLSLLSGITLSLYSGGFALQAIGVRVKRQWSVIIVAVLLAGITGLIAFGITGGMNELFRDVATTLAVPTAAWAGIFAAETIIRNRRYASESLVRRGGVYADVRWVNLIALVLITGVGYALTTATVEWLSWQGYGFPLFDIPLDSDLAGTDFGVLAALGLGLLVPVIAGIPAIRKQEATEL